MSLCALIAALALLCWPGTRRTAIPLVERVLPVPAVAERARSGVPARMLLAVAAGGAVFAFVGGVQGAIIAAAAGAGSYLLMRRSAARASGDQSARARELPRAADVMALVLRSGADPSAALSFAASVLDGPLGCDLERIGALQRMGKSPLDSWVEQLSDPVLGPLAAAAIRSADSGAVLADAWSKVAVDARADRVLRVEVAARRAGISALAPLGLCFLPAFICIGVVPIVIGLAKGIFVR